MILSRVNNIVTGSVRDLKTLQNNCPAIVQRELRTEKTSSDNCRRLLESTSWSIYQQLDLPDRYCPDIVQILSRYCPDIVRILSGYRPDIVWQVKYHETSAWSKLDLYSTSDNFETTQGDSFSRSIVFSWSRDLVCYQNQVFQSKI